MNETLVVPSSNNSTFFDAISPYLKNPNNIAPLYFESKLNVEYSEDLTLGDNSWRQWKFEEVILKTIGRNGGIQSGSYYPYKLFDGKSSTSYDGGITWESYNNTNLPVYIEITYASNCTFTGYGFVPGYGTSYTHKSWEVSIDNEVVSSFTDAASSFQTGIISKYEITPKIGKVIKFKLYDMNRHVIMQELEIYGKRI